jgi:hypothetical protein
MKMHGLFLFSILALSAVARANGEGDRCDAILQQDLFNRVSNSTNAKSSERVALEDHLFSVDDAEAFDRYEKAFASSKAQNTSGATEFHYGVIGGELEFSHSYDRKLQQKDFSEKFNKAKKQYQRNVTSSSARDTSLISLYTSSVRDPASVKAWENCMTSSRAGPGLIAYGYRDPRGSPYIVVIWAPGSFAASAPVVDVKFGVTDVGMSIEGGDGKVQIATGSGASYPIRFTAPGDRRALADGFAVLVNGELRSGGKLIQSFHAEATVPRNLGPTPCALVFGGSRNYQFGLTDPETREVKLIGEFSTGAKLPSDQAEVEVYQTEMGTKGGSFMRLREDQVTFIERMPRGRNSTEWRDVTRMTGTCSGEGVRVKMTNVPELDGISMFIRSM